jgi:hypothetical protein
MGSTTSTRRAATTAVPQGSHVFKFSRYNQHRKQLERLDQSAVFAVGGYYWQIGVFPGGLHESSKDYMAVYLFLQSE